MLASRTVSRLAKDRRGSVAIIAAASATLLIACSAGAVDVGLIYLKSRKLQGMADLAAMAAARDLTSAQAAAQATVTANNFGEPVSATVTTGRYDANPAKAQDKRFSKGGSDQNAVRVELESQADLVFGKVILGKAKLPISRTATAARAEMAAFSIGTRLAALDGGVANALLSALTGSTVSLSVADYNALADADLDLLDFAGALRTKLSLQGASYDEVLAANLTTGEALTVASQVLAAAGEAQAAASMNKIALASNGLGAADLDALIDLGPLGAQDKVVSVNSTRVGVSALDLANAMLLAANENRQVQLDLGASVPGVTDLDIYLGVGERPNQSPWLTLDNAGTVTVRTNQARLFLRAKALGALGVLGVKPLNLPVFVELASGEAKLAAISCPGVAASNRVSLDVRPSVGDLAIADIDTTELDDFQTPVATPAATIIDLPLLLKVTAKAGVELGGKTWKRVEFTRSEIEARTVKSVQTTDIAESAVGTLIEDTKLTVKLVGLPLSLDGSILSALKTIGAPLDVVLNSLTGLLGVRLGEADVRVHGLRCHDAVLVA